MRKPLPSTTKTLPLFVALLPAIIYALPQHLRPNETTTTSRNDYYSAEDKTQAPAPSTSASASIGEISTSSPIGNERCTGIPQVGGCKSYVHKWAFNATEQTCDTFMWGGCGGNPLNRFDSEADCLHYCLGKENTPPPYRYRPIKPYNTTPHPVTPPRDYTNRASPIPFGQRGKELTFHETGEQKTFTFAQTNAYIQLDGDIIETFQLRLCREISFQFRTRLPHGLLVYHNVQVPAGIKLDPYALYVIVQQGQLKVVHVFGKHKTTLTVGRGLNRDEWHSVTVRIDVHLAKLIAVVDDVRGEVPLSGLHEENNYGISESLDSVVLIGGLSSEEKLHGVKYIIESFVGCIRDIVLSAGKSASDLLMIQPLVAAKHENVQEGCHNLCNTIENLCFVGSRCINHYNALTCDCFGTKYEGEQCDIYTSTILTLRGSSYVSYRVYDWKDRVHSSMNRFSVIFKTRYDDSALFYASGEINGTHHFIAASIKNHSVHLEFDFGEGHFVSDIGDRVTDNFWYNLTIFHDQRSVRISVNDQVKLLDIPGNMYHLYIDPEIYIGGGPEIKNKRGLVSHNNFAGNLKYVFYNDISIIYELRKQNPKVHYIGVLEPEFYEADVEVIPITYPFATSHIWWPNHQTESLSLTFDFKSSRSLAVLASSDVTTADGLGYWEVRAVNDEIRFELVPDAGKNVTQLTSVKYEPNAHSWHTVEVSYSTGELKLTVDHRHKQAQMFGLQFQLGDKVIVGSGLRGNAATGLIGCMREVTVNGEYLEPRHVVQTERVVGEVALDDCKFIDPCHRPNTCEHGGKCSVNEDRLTCDCNGTGYIGKNCHFAEFRKTCEELALLGYTKPDVYLIDIDGNGRFPPAHVRCEFQSLEDSTKTIVEHNLPSQVDVRSAGEADFSFHIKYREFTAEMLQELISHSLYCSQYIKYDCYKAPLELHSATWLVSSYNNHTVDHIGEAKRGTCPCAINRTCKDPSQWCNCDVSEAKWNSDEGYYNQQNSLGITDMIFLQQPGLDEDAQGRITLGPLECVETNTQKYVVTFTTSQSYIEVPGWRKGDLAFSFRTTGEKAILLYQPPIRPKYPSFMVALTSDYHLTFNFTLNTGASRELVIKSNRKLNEGEWHKLWIDYNQYHVRFMINTDYQMVDLRPEEEFGPFEGSMFIGGAPSSFLKKSSVTQGLIGCFRGLVVNGEILDIYSYMSVHLSEIIKDCKPSCVPNPCKNDARCRELWSTFQCVCQNPWAHLGQYCEKNINTKAITFITPESYLKKNYLGNATDEDKEILKKMMEDTLLMNLRTYDRTSLVLYSNDHLNNFVHIFINNLTQLVYLFNYGDTITNITVDYPKLSSGESVQIAIVREENSTTLHVNEVNKTINVGVELLTEYSNKPWSNPDREVLAPPRPPAPPTEYFQLNLGGYDDHSLLKMSNSLPALPGYVGCIRGLQIGDILIDLPAKALEDIQNDPKGVKPGCQMKCDARPCKHEGICVEDFRRQEHSCICDHTSYYGESCNEEKGADFSGESVLQRKFVLKGPVTQVRVQLAFSSNDMRKRNTVLLLLQTENIRSYYLLVALTSEGHLIFEEDREDGATYGARISDRDFLNGARHSVYYRRQNGTSELLIDRQSIELLPIQTQALQEMPDQGSDEVQVGGLNTSDPRFAIYKGYNGCLSNLFLEVNGYSMKPLEEYMMFTKTGSEKVNVTNSHGVRSAQCSDQFDIIHKSPSGPTLNISHGLDKAWVEDPPGRIPYKSLYADSNKTEENTGRAVFIAFSTFFVVVILGALYEVYRSDRAYRRRQEMETDASILRSKEQAAKLQEGVNFKSDSDDDLQKPPVLVNGVQMAPLQIQNSNNKNGFANNVTTPVNVTTPTVAPATPTTPTGTVASSPQQSQKQQNTTTTTTIPRYTPLQPIIESPPMRKRDVADDEEYEEEELPPPYHKTNGKRISFRDSKDMDEELEWDPLDEKTELLNGGDSEDEAPSRVDSNEINDLPEPFKSDNRERPKSELINRPLLSPVFLNQDQRTFSNPISYLGGPLLPSKPRSSLESILSLD